MNHKTWNMKNSFPACAPLLLLALSPFAVAYADQATVINSISVSTDTGGNTAGEVNQGTESVEIEIRQEINGEELPPVVISKRATSTPIEVTIDREETGEGYRSEIHVKAQAGAAKVPQAESASTHTEPDESEESDEAVAVRHIAEAPVFHDLPRETFLTSLALSFHELWGAVIQSLRPTFSWLF